MALTNKFLRQVDEAVRGSAARLLVSFQRGRQFATPSDRNRNPSVSEDGQSLVELALTIPILLTLVFCFLELCLAFYTHNMISEAAREGTRYAMFRGASCPTIANPTCEVTATQVQDYVLGIGLPNIGGGTMTVVASYPNNGSEAVGSPVKVKVTYIFRITMPFVPPNAITMSSTSQMNIVQ